MFRHLIDSPIWRLASVVVILAAPGCGPSAPAVGSAPRPRDSIQVPYGTQARQSATEGVSTVDSTVARRTTPTTLADMLVGRVPGLEVRRLPSGGVSLRIRGDRSLMANNEPLIVVDGIPMEGDNNSVLQDIDPRDVASVTVLKDAGSLAAYGSRGANGVVLIITKKRWNGGTVERESHTELSPVCL